MIETDVADKLFSEFIRKRDPKCKRCKWKPTTDCSHFWERGSSSTRYDPRNADGLCRECHVLWEGRRNGAKEYKIKQLGKKVYAELERLHNTTMKRDVAISNFLATHPDVIK